jgi:iron complex outermembrane receptor protein
MMRRFLIFNLLLIICYSGMGQVAHSLLDTVLLDEVVTFGELRKYQSGAKIDQIPVSQVQLSQEGGIENVLRRFTPVYIKSDAGGLSTIHFRGTSASHTAINFGGINLNSLTLGQSNLSNIPMFLFDGVSVQYGSSSTINGSGAIGGAVYLTLSEEWTDGLKVTAKTSVGSFGEYLAGGKVYLGNSKWESVTRAYWYQKENDFPFNNYYTGDVENPGPVRDIQHGASVENKAILQEVNYRFSKKQFIKSSFWIGSNWYQVQPNMQSNYHYTGTQVINDDNIRIWADYTNNEHKINFKGGAGFVHDMQIYDNNENQQIGTNRFLSEFEASTSFSSGLGVKAGAAYKYLKPDVYTYSDSVIDHENQLDLYVSSFYQVSRNLRFSLNLRQMFVTNFEAPFTPSFGAEYSLRTGNDSYLKFTSTLARSFRVPTFNDRYWGTQGNPDLKPESGKNAELGVMFYAETGDCQTTFGLNAFYIDVENWIEWRHFGEWQAQNVLEVVSKGIEFQSNTCFKIGKFDFGFSLNYTYNPIEPVKNVDENGLLDRQMNYSPLHMGNAVLEAKYKSWRIFTDGQYTGWRYTDDFGRTLDAFFVANCGVEYQFNIKKQHFDVVFSLQNFLNADYQNEKYYAMPGRSFRLGLKYDLNLNN